MALVRPVTFGGFSRLKFLHRMPRGEGSLSRVTMTANDLYQRLHFIPQHAKRHVQQLEANEAAFVNRASRTSLPE